MSNLPPPPRAASMPAAPRVSAPAAPSVGLARREVRRSPLRMAMLAQPGWGKTTFGAQAPGAGIIMARGETGYDTLIGVGRVPERDSVIVEDWQQLLSLIDSLNPGQYQNLVFDAIGGFERLCHEHVCKRDFKNDWTDSGFLSYHKGYDLAVNDWLSFLSRLERLNNAGTGVIFLGHVNIKNFKNPVGPDFDQYVADCHPKTWAATHKWLDTVLLGRFQTIVDKVDKKGNKGKGIGGQERIVCTTHCDAWDCKNRYGMPEIIEIPDDYTAVWSTLEPFITGDKS